jgi:hypothetical protein
MYIGMPEGQWIGLISLMRPFGIDFRGKMRKYKFSIIGY